MRKIITKEIIIGLIIISLFLLTGCRNIATKKELIKYATSNYGRCECIDYIKNGENDVDDNSIATFKDKEYGFIYYIESYIHDDAIFGPMEGKNSNFDEVYISYIKGSLSSNLSEFEERYKCKLEWYDGSYELVSIDLEDKFLAEDASTKLGRLIKKIDTRKYFEGIKINVLYDGEDIGEYDFYTDKYYTREEAHIKWVKGRIFSIMKYDKNVNIKSEEELKYIKMEVMNVNNIPNISNENMAYRITDTEETYENIEVYYFKYKNQTWILADCLVGNGTLYVSRIE